MELGLQCVDIRCQPLQDVDGTTDTGPKPSVGEFRFHTSTPGRILSSLSFQTIQPVKWEVICGEKMSLIFHNWK